MKNNIPDEMIMELFSDELSQMTFERILYEVRFNPELKKEISILTSVSNDINKFKTELRKEIEMLDARILAIQPNYVPMLLKAAPHKDLKAIGDSVVLCEQEILKEYKQKVSLEALLKLSKDNNWLQDEGTPLYNIGRILEDYRFTVIRKYGCFLWDIENELEGGCQVIVVVNGEKLQGKDMENLRRDQAVIVKRLTRNFITLYDPQHQRKYRYRTDQFLFAWKDSDNYLVSVARPGRREYEPDPIQVTNLPLEEDFKELSEAIAEYSHDIWSMTKMNEGWRYGKERNDNIKRHPKLVPYRDLKENEKKYDRKIAQSTLELIQKLGYKIVKEI